MQNNNNNKKIESVSFSFSESWSSDLTCCSISAQNKLVLCLFLCHSLKLCVDT